MTPFLINAFIETDKDGLPVFARAIINLDLISEIHIDPKYKKQIVYRLSDSYQKFIEICADERKAQARLEIIYGMITKQIKYTDESNNHSENISKKQVQKYQAGDKVYILYPGEIIEIIEIKSEYIGNAYRVRLADGSYMLVAEGLLQKDI